MKKNNQIEVEVPTGGNVIVFTDLAAAIVQEGGTIQFTLNGMVLPAGTKLYVKEKQDG